MAKLTVVFGDKVIVKDGVALHCEDSEITAFDAVVSSQNHGNLSAIQWENNAGEKEYTDKSNFNQAVSSSEVTPYDTLYETIKEERRQTIKTETMAQDAEHFGRLMRNSKLTETDWWASSDRAMTAEQIAYRQALRDLPSHATDWNPAWLWDDDTWQVSLVGITWPTKPE